MQGRYVSVDGRCKGMEEIRCPKCGSKDVKHLVGEIYVCRDCGAEFTLTEWNEPIKYNKGEKDTDVERW